ncbi:MAG: hypothetical protein AB1412_15470 [Pseudomonadota bacterium]
MPVFSFLHAQARRSTLLLGAIGLSAAVLSSAAFAQTAPSFTAGPDDLMRVLPARLLPALQADCHGIRTVAPAWRAQLDASAALLVRLNQAQVPEQQAVLPMAMLCPAPSPLATAWSRAAEQASNLVKLDFPGAPGEVSGASFLGPQGSRVLLINRSMQPVRVKLGTWVPKDARLDQFTQGDAASNPPKIEHLRRPLGAADEQGVLLPPLSLSVIG